MAAPARAGFGSKLLERIVSPYFNGEARLKFPATGCSFELVGEISTAPEH